MLRMIAEFVLVCICFYVALWIIELMENGLVALCELVPALPWILMLVLAAVPMLTAINAGRK